MELLESVIVVMNSTRVRAVLLEGKIYIGLVPSA